MTDELKPCPFCGCDVIIPMEAVSFWISCFDCGANTAEQLNPVDAEEAWNLRAALEVKR